MNFLSSLAHYKDFVKHIDKYNLCNIINFNMRKQMGKIIIAFGFLVLTSNISLAEEAVSLEASAAQETALQEAVSAQEPIPQAPVQQEVVLPEITVPVVEEAGPKLIEAVEVLSGYGWSRINAKNDHELKRDYDLYPIYIDFDFNFKNIIKKIGLNPPVAVLFQLEPYIAAVSSPNSNVEIGNSFMFKVGLVPEAWKFQPYVKAGAGMVWMSQHTREQSTQFNFIETGVVGAQYSLKNNISLLLEARMRHLSNAGIKQPNHGINSYFAVAGLSYKY